MVRYARKRQTTKAANARNRRGTSPNRFFIGLPNLPDIPKLRIGVTQAFSERLCQSEADFCAHAGMEVDDVDQVRVKEPDQLRSLARDRRRRTCRIAEQCHLAEEIAGLQFREQQMPFGSVLKNNIDTSGPDNVH